MKNKSNVKRGFTLVELLIVVLIVGILVSVALPLYQNAVDKSRWAKLLSPSRAIANAEEAILMSNGTYTVNKEDLSVSLPNDGEYDYQLYTSANGDDGDLVRVSSDKLEDVRLARHYEKDARFPGHVYCEAKSTNERAKKLCGKLLQGSELLTTDDGYKAYFLSGQVNAEVCGAANGFWSSSKNTCYQTQTDKCAAVGGNALSNGQCGWKENSNGRTIGEDQFCLATSGWCRYTTVNNGGICFADVGNFGCTNDGTHPNGAINDGGICAMGASATYTCLMPVNAGGVCYANASNTCTNYNGGCCCGPKCPGNAPRCDPAKCAEVKAKIASYGFEMND